MLYLFYTDKRFLIDKEIKKITKDISDIEITKYDGSADIKTIIDDASTMSMFSDKKTIIVDNAVMFNSKGEYKELARYLENYNPNTTLIFIVNDVKVDNRKKITKLIKKNGVIKDFSENYNPNAYVKSLLNGYNILPRTIELFISRVGNNLLTLENEVNKIILYKENDKNITDDDIISLTVKTSFEDIFKLIDYIVSGNKEKSLEVYNEMKILGEDDIKIIIMLAGQFRILYQTKILLKKGLGEKGITDVLKIHPYRVKLAVGKCRKFSENTLLKYISDLADIDYKIKSGLINKDYAFPMFILKN